jgi:hypothetical protein
MHLSEAERQELLRLEHTLERVDPFLAQQLCSAVPGPQSAPAIGIALSRKLGPYVLSECLRRGNQAMVDDAWDDYE